MTLTQPPPPDHRIRVSDPRFAASYRHWTPAILHTGDGNPRRAACFLDSFQKPRLTADMPAPDAVLRDRGLRVTKQRVAVIQALQGRPHADAETVASRVREAVGQISTQAVYDVLNTLTEIGLVRRIQLAGSSARYEMRVGDNHHHLVCKSCGDVTDVDCAVGEAPCLEPGDLDALAPGFVVDQAEVTYWGTCPDCAVLGAHGTH
jgi:Fur family ferric uptake transcriptional regulator